MNADAAFRMVDGSGGGGVVMRDHHGGFVAGASYFPPYVADGEGAELMACRRAVKLPHELRLSKVVMETDSMGAAMKLTKEDKDRSVHGRKYPVETKFRWKPVKTTKKT